MNNTFKFSIGLFALLSIYSITEARVTVDITKLHPERISNLIPFQYTGPADYYPDAIDLSVIENAANKLSRVNYEFKLLDYTGNKYSIHSVYAGFELLLRFDGLKGVQAKDVSIEKDETGWFGTITLENSQIHFTINRLSVDLFRDISINGTEMFSFSEYFMLPKKVEDAHWNFQTVDVHDSCVEFSFRSHSSLLWTGFASGLILEKSGRFDAIG